MRKKFFKSKRRFRINRLQLRSLSLFVLGLLLAANFCSAQTATVKPSEPEALGVFFYLGPADQSLKALPQEDFEKHQKASVGWAFGTGIYDRFYLDKVILDGTASPLRTVGSQPAFIFKPLPGEDMARYKLMPCTVHKNKREYKLGDYKGKHFIPMRPIEVTISKYGDESYKLVPSQPLVAGEYGLLTEEKVYTFGVDAVK
ncbi:MAG: hypothetical protein WCF61_15170 [Terriglobales bacterium]